MHTVANAVRITFRLIHAIVSLGLVSAAFEIDDNAIFLPSLAAFSLHKTAFGDVVGARAAPPNADSDDGRSARIPCPLRLPQLQDRRWHDSVIVT